jgi:hypothetical protein|tara:strand:+ start:673 stop:1389 length:717 start_codon:yes stop_codon:yes gene_type:complete
MGLMANDLSNTIDKIFEIDSFASKMGDDKNIVTLSFSLTGKEAAKDLSNFLEKGYSFILDSDVTEGEQSDGTYKVFVEMERDNEVGENIFEILDGVKKLSGKDDFKFRYYKGFRSYEATQDKISEMVPTDPDKYGISMQENALNNYKTFFSNSYVDNIAMNENKITVKKKFSDSLVFEFIDFGDTLSTIKHIDESFDILNSYPEILFLTKYLGDYNISKYGDKLVFENETKALVLKRI